MAALIDFIAQVKEDGLARQNRFTVNISLPSGMPNLFNELNVVHLFCEQATLPGLSVATSPIRTFGETREMVSDRTFENITLVFLVDTKMLVKKLFDEWMNIIVDPTTRLTGYFDQYATKMNIIVQDTQNNNTYECELRDVYPKAVQAITLDNNSKDVMKLSVTFSYKNHFNRNWATSPSDSLIDKNLNKNAEGLTLQQYGQSAISMDSNTNELYYSNFQEYQQRLNDSAAISNSINKLERQGFETDLGGLFQ